MPPNSFKSDESFLQKLAVGAAGTKATINRLRELGFDPIELERGSTGYKIWKKIKIKRVRFQNILCLRTGQRFESRGKTNLEISMSHSLKDPYRAWNTGMRPDDHVAVLLCKQFDDSPVSWDPVSPIHFVVVADMIEAVSNGRIQVSKPKGVEEDTEIRMIWPCTLATDDSFVTEVNERAIKLQSTVSGRTQRCILTRRNFSLLPQCNAGDLVSANQIVASVVQVNLNPIPNTIVDEEYFITQLQSVSLSERYAAAKALRFRGHAKASKFLSERMLDEAEDIYVKLEAAAALAASNDASGWEFLSTSVDSEYLTVQLETIIVLSEVHDPRSEQILINVLTDVTRENEIRAGAAWALGEFPTGESALSLIDTFNSASLEIKVEAARALLRITPSQVDRILEILKLVESDKRDGIAWALARTGSFDPKNLLDGEIDDNLRRWVSYVIGYGKPLFIEDQISELAKMDAEVHFAASVLWQILASWVSDLKEY